jgi:hypothetical protein
VGFRFAEPSYGLFSQQADATRGRSIFVLLSFQPERLGAFAGHSGSGRLPLAASADKAAPNTLPGIDRQGVAAPGAGAAHGFAEAVGVRRGKDPTG